jgi:hypothetical protein
MSIIQINTVGGFKKISIKNKSFNSCINQSNLLYWWEIDDFKYESYGSVESEDKDINIHKLPDNGISDFLEESSKQIDLYGNIYIVKKNDKNKIINLTIDDYTELHKYFIDENDSSDSESDEEIEIGDTIENINTYKQFDDGQLDYDDNTYI